MRPLIAIVWLASTASYAGCASGHGQATLDDLGHASVKSFAARDASRFLALRPTPDDYADTCSVFAGLRSQVKQRLDADEEAVRASYQQCAAIDWGRMTDLTVTGGAPDAAVAGCPDVVQLDPLQVEGTMNGKTYRATLPTSIALDGHFYPLAAPQCTDPDARHPAVAVAEWFADAACACADVTCVRAAAEAFGKRTQELAATGRTGTEVDAKAISEATKRGTDCIVRLQQ